MMTSKTAEMISGLFCVCVKYAVQQIHVRWALRSFTIL